MTIDAMLRDRLSEESKDILLVTSIRFARRIKEYLVKALRKDNKRRVIAMPESLKVRDGDTFFHFYIFPDSWTLRKNIVGLRYKSFYYVYDEYEKIIDAILKEL